MSRTLRIVNEFIRAALVGEAAGLTVLFTSGANLRAAFGAAILAGGTTLFVRAQKGYFKEPPKK